MNKVTLNVGGRQIEITPEVLKINRSPEEFITIKEKKLRHPVVGAALIKYNNDLGINFTRLHNLYSYNLEEFFIDIEGNLLYFDKDITEYEVDPGISSGYLYTVNGIYR